VIIINERLKPAKKPDGATWPRCQLYRSSPNAGLKIFEMILGRGKPLHRISALASLGRGKKSKALHRISASWQAGAGEEEPRPCTVEAKEGLSRKTGRLKRI
jgi:hypothetical protein